MRMIRKARRNVLVDSKVRESMGKRTPVPPKKEAGMCECYLMFVRLISPQREVDH